MPALPPVVDPEERDFQRLYGPWSPLAPAGVAVLLAGWERPWWIAGGWAIEAFTGQPRGHEDVDVAYLRSDTASLRAHLHPAYHLWAAGSGSLRPLGGDDELPGWADQAWVREHAWSPWLVDMLATPERHGRWVFRRDPSVTVAWGEVGWADAGGLSYLRPELVLAYKAKLDRPKDRADLAATLPRLDVTARTWLRNTVTRAHAGHPWLDLL